MKRYSIFAVGIGVRAIFEYNVPLFVHGIEYTPAQMEDYLRCLGYVSIVIYPL